MDLDLKIAIGIIAFCLFNYLYLIPTQVIAQGSSPTYPYLVNSMLMVFSIGYLVESLLANLTKVKNVQEGRQHGKFAAGSGEPCDRAAPVVVDRSKALRVLALLGLMVVWYWTLGSLGFLLSAFIFLVISSIIYGAKSPVKIFLLSAGMPIIFHILFWLLGSSLPEGPVEEFIISTLYR